jgi:hypothetical protein
MVLFFIKRSKVQTKIYIQNRQFRNPLNILEKKLFIFSKRHAGLFIFFRIKQEERDGVVFGWIKI